MPLPHKKSLSKAANAGTAWAKRAGRRQPTKPELAKIEARRIDEQQRKARAAGRKPKKPKQKPEPPKESFQERATRAIGLGGLLDALKPKKGKKK